VETDKNSAAQKRQIAEKTDSSEEQH